MPVAIERWHGQFQLTRPARGATRRLYRLSFQNSISTHTPREGRDHAPHCGARIFNYFNSHAPRGARPVSQPLSVKSYSKFQLTRPARGATDILYSMARNPGTFQLTRPARGATNNSPKTIIWYRISTHTPREGRDVPPPSAVGECSHFNSHAPRGARPGKIFSGLKSIQISTHTPREGRDGFTMTIKNTYGDFNSHAPRGARRGLCPLAESDNYISTHTPREGRDVITLYHEFTIKSFQLTRPARGATPLITAITVPSAFQLTRPARGATDGNKITVRTYRISTHTPREGRDI